MNTTRSPFRHLAQTNLLILFFLIGVWLENRNQLLRREIESPTGGMVMVWNQCGTHAKPSSINTASMTFHLSFTPESILRTIPDCDRVDGAVDQRLRMSTWVVYVAYEGF